MDDRFTKIAIGILSAERLNGTFSERVKVREEFAAALRTVAEETRQRCAAVAREHKPPPPPKRAYLLASDEMRTSIIDETRGEKIAAKVISAAIEALDLKEAPNAVPKVTP